MSAIKRLPGETKEDAKLRAQKEAQANAEAEKRALGDVKRKLYSAWQIWKFCPYKRCRRACACTGDADRCFKRFWPLVPEDAKVEFRAFITARARDKLPQDEAVRHARAERNRYLEMETRFARQKAEQEAAAAARFAPPQPRYVPEDRAPRVRSW